MRKNVLMSLGYMVLMDRSCTTDAIEKIVSKLTLIQTGIVVCFYIYIKNCTFILMV